MKKPRFDLAEQVRVLGADSLLPLDAIADTVLRYRPKPQSKPAKKRQRRKRKLERE